MVKSKVVKIPNGVEAKVRQLQRDLTTEFKRQHNIKVKVPFTKSMDAYFKAMETRKPVAVAKSGKIVYVYP